MSPGVCDIRVAGACPQPRASRVPSPLIYTRPLRISPVSGGISAKSIVFADASCSILSAVITGVSYAISIIGILVVVVLAELPSLRRAEHLDLASAVRDRSR